jgi:ZIP family zinc transporter
MPAAGNLIGGFAAEFLDLQRKYLSQALHLAAGILIGVVGLELMPESLKAEPPWAAVLAFMIGAVGFITLDMYIDRAREKFSEVKKYSSVIFIYLSVAIDLLTDGIIISTAALINFKLGLFLAFAQVIADFPEGFATSIVLKSKIPKFRYRFLLMLAFFIPVYVGAIFGYTILKHSHDTVKYIILAFAAGILLTITMEKILKEAHKIKDTYSEALMFILGFALFALATSYLV